jgi:hypothetical protein
MPPRQLLILIMLVPLTAVALALLGSALIQTTAQGPNDLQLSAGVFLSPANAEWLALGALAPLGIAFAFAWQWEKPETAYFQPEILGIYSSWITLVNGYAVLYIIRLAGLLPNLNPAPQTLTDSRFTSLPVNWLVVALPILSTAFFFWFLFLRPNGFGRLADRIALPHRRLVLLGALTAVALTIWLLSGIYFALLMVLPTWLWLFVEPSDQPFRKAINVVLTLVGGAALLAPIFFLPSGLNLWTLLLDLAYTVIWPLDVLLYIFVLALFVRFLRLGLSKPYVAPLIPEDPLFQILKLR